MSSDRVVAGVTSSVGRSAGGGQAVGGRVLAYGGRAQGRAAGTGAEAARAHESTPARPAPINREAAAAMFSREIPRFRRSERELHWSIAIPFMVCLASGIVIKLFFNHLHAQLLVHSALLWVHRISGACLVLLPPLSAWRHRKDLSLYLYNIKRAWTWTLDDIKWLLLVGPATLVRRVKLPDQHKFNAGEKVNFMSLMLTYPVLVTTGVLLYTPGVNFLSFIVHVSVAILSAPLIFGHIFMAVVNPDTRVGLSGMFSGNVDREWARHHYAKWYAENFGDDAEPEPMPEEVVAGPQAEALVRCSACGAETPLASWARLLDSVAELRPLDCPACGAPSAVVAAVVKAEDIGAILEGLEEAGVSGPRRRALSAASAPVTASATEDAGTSLAPCPSGA
jgi:formate dehydrogenase subunit gamma